MRIELRCPQCQNINVVTPLSHCQKCHAVLFKHPTEKFLTTFELDQCPVCGCSHLYRQKDFNRKWGVLLVGLGVILAYFTYGISLLVVTLLDWWLYRRVKEVVVCYQCKALFRNYSGISRIEPFNLSLHDYYRSLATPP